MLYTPMMVRTSLISGGQYLFAAILVRLVIGSPLAVHAALIETLDSDAAADLAEAIEGAIDAVEDASDEVQSIAVKHA